MGDGRYCLSPSSSWFLILLAEMPHQSPLCLPTAHSSRPLPVCSLLCVAQQQPWTCKHACSEGCIAVSEPDLFKSEAEMDVSQKNLGDSEQIVIEIQNKKTGEITFAFIDNLILLIAII